ncbi:MAG: c-type cytochrome [Sphingobacteriales bacterium]|nr:MAG: c-type cytochrome [Sphingobacteriales bacterium]
MKKVLKWFAVIVIIVAAIAGSGVGYLKFMLPDVGKAPELKVEITSARVARGEYLANAVNVCMDCHSRRDWSAFAGPMIPGTEGGGGEVFNRDMGFPGVFYSRNITPAGLGSWTDGEIYRAITAGVNKDNEALFPVMPYHYYGSMDNEDVYSLIAYLRSLKPVQSTIAKREMDFPVNLIVNTIPHKGTPTPRPDPADTLAYGRYMVNASGCVECHTKANDKGQIIAGMEFAGGREFKMPGGTLRTPNLTPDATGIGYWDRAKFIRTFKQYQDSTYHSPKLGPADFNTIMPWTMYAKMTEADLASIYAYLRTIKPMKNELVKFTAGAATASN